jgi:hypothetical protein
MLRQLATPARLGPRTQRGHPIARSAEPGEVWSWCYLDEAAFRMTDSGSERR